MQTETSVHMWVQGCGQVQGALGVMGRSSDTAAIPSAGVHHVSVCISEPLLSHDDIAFPGHFVAEKMRLRGSLFIANDLGFVLLFWGLHSLFPRQ